MPRYVSGYFLEIFLEGPITNGQGQVERYKKEVMEKLRELERRNPEIEIWPKIGISNVIKITSQDSLSLSDWAEIKRKVKEIIGVKNGSEEAQKARKELEEKILEFLRSNPEKMHTLEAIAEAIELPSYWKGFNKLQKEVIVSIQLTELSKLGEVEEIAEEKEFRRFYYYQIKHPIFGR